METPADFTATYENMTDDQLLEVAAEGGLVPEATAALQSEMRHRNLSTGMVQKYRTEVEHNELAQKAETQNLRTDYRGTGFRLFGRDYLSEEDRRQGIQVRTKWFTFSYLPIFPIASFRYACKDEVIGLAHVKEENVINRVPLNWNQAMQTWVKSTGLVILAISVAFLYAVWHNRQHR